MNRPMLPLGASTPDELLAAAQDPGLTDAERREVDAWLAEHPEWHARARGYDAIRSAARLPVAATDARPPELAAMTGLWAAIDDHQRSGPAPAHGFAPPTVGPPASLDAQRARRRRTSTWLLAAAAALVVVAAGAVIINTGGGGGDTATDLEPSPPSQAGAPAGPPDQAVPGVEPGASDDTGQRNDQLTALAQLREGAELTTDMGTADIVFRSLATADVSGGVIGEETGEDTVYFETVGRGQLALPDRSILSMSTTTRVGERTDFFPVMTGVTVKNGERSFVRCGGEADFTELLPTDTSPTATTSGEPAPGEDCFTTVVSPDNFAPDVALDVIGQESFASSGLVQLGTDTLSDGSVITGYQTSQPLTLDDGQVVDLTLQIWMDDDQFIRRVVSGADFSAGEFGYPTNLVISYELFNLGIEVDIPELD